MERYCMKLNINKFIIITANYLQKWKEIKGELNGRTYILCKVEWIYPNYKWEDEHLLLATILQRFPKRYMTRVFRGSGSQSIYRYVLKNTIREIIVITEKMNVCFFGKAWRSLGTESSKDWGTMQQVWLW